MAITTIDQLELALDSRYTTIIGSKASIIDALAGHYMSSWRTAGLPGTGVLPTTPAVPNSTTTGGFPFMQQTAPAKSYLAQLQYMAGTTSCTLEIHDRLLHNGGLVGNVTTLQTVTGMDMNSFLATSNLDTRKGDANFSDVQWWLEIYSELGSTTANATVNVTYNDSTTGNLNTFTVGNNDRRLSRIFPLNGLIPVADQGKYIRGINSLQLSASTATAGNLGFVATRYRGSVYAEQANENYKRGWTEIGLNEIFNDSCLFMIILCTSTSTGLIRVSGKIVHG